MAGQIRSSSAVIFRRIAGKTRKNDKGESVDTYISLAKDQAEVIRQKLLQTLASESDRGVRNKISDAVAEVARQCSDNGACNKPFHVWLRADFHRIYRRLMARPFGGALPA